VKEETMTDVTDEMLEELLDAAYDAESVAPGPWEQWADSGSVGIRTVGGENTPSVFSGAIIVECESPEVDGEDDDECDELEDVNKSVIARHVAAASPAVVMALVGEIRRLRRGAEK
jgi:hypothetical protein